MDKIEANYDTMPNYLDRLPLENIQNVFDTFIEHNFSDEEEFYENQREIDGMTRKKYSKRKLYKTIEEFESGYEKKHNENAINSILQQEDFKIKKIHLKDVLKLDFGVLKYELPNEMYHPNRNLRNNEFIAKNISELSTQKMKDKKDVIIIEIEDDKNKQRYKFNNSDNMKIMTVSQSLNIKYELLEPYIKNYYKYEDISDQIEIIDSDNKQVKHNFEPIYFKETQHEHKIIAGLSLTQLEKRASLLVNSRFSESYNTMSIILKFLVLLKKLKNNDLKKKGVILSSNNMMVEGKKNDKIEKMRKVKNTILSSKNLTQFFQEAKDSNKKELTVSSLKSTICDYEKMRRDEQFISLKEKMRQIINEDENSIDDLNNNPNDINNNILENDGMNIKDNLTNSKLRSKRKSNRLGSQTDIVFKEALPEFIPQHHSKFKKDLKSYIQFQIKGKK